MEIEKVLGLGLTEEQAKAVVEMVDVEMTAYVKREEHEGVISTLKSDMEEERLLHKVESELRAANAKNWKAVYSLIDRGEISVGENGELLGLLEQVEMLRESDGYLFDDGRKEGVRTGGVGNFPRGSLGKKSNPWEKGNFNLTEQGRLLKNEPTLAKRLMNEAGV